MAAVASIALLAGDPLTARIEDARMAAQALQGSLDGAWTLREVGRPDVYRLAVTDPPGSRAPARGAWLDTLGQIGAAELAHVGPRRLHLSLTGGPRVDVVLYREPGQTWRGRFSGRRFTLVRDAARPSPR